MGLPSRGRDYCVARLAQLGRRRVPVFANIGGFSAEEIAASLSQSSLTSTRSRSA
jgi:dihydroorotate dehydrogenase (fumarate)/dihydroorotate dehydrogenase